MKNIIILIHGYNVWDLGASTVGKLRPFFAPYGSYVMLQYGHFAGRPRAIVFTSASKKSRDLLNASYHSRGNTRRRVRVVFLGLARRHDVGVGLLQGKHGFRQVVDAETVCAFPFAVLVLVPDFQDDFCEDLLRKHYEESDHHQ